MHINDKRVVKASFKDCPPSDRKLFSVSDCIIPISVGQSVHEDKKLSATLKLISSAFTSCTILIDDSIQRYTMKIWDTVNSDEIIYRKAIEEGDFWLERNKKYLSILDIPFSILRWDDWLAHPNYMEFYTFINQQYLDNREYHEAINENIKTFIVRNIDFEKNKHVSYIEAYELCLSYLKEECAVMMLWAESNYDFEVYPTGRNKAMTATYEYFIRPRYKNLLKPVSLRFKKYNPLKNEQSDITASILYGDDIL